MQVYIYTRLMDGMCQSNLRPTSPSASSQKAKEWCLLSLSSNESTISWWRGGDRRQTSQQLYVVCISSTAEQLKYETITTLFLNSFSLQQIKCRMSTRRLFMRVLSLFIGEGTCFTPIDAIHEYTDCHQATGGGGDVLHNYNVADGWKIRRREWVAQWGVATGSWEAAHRENLWIKFQENGEHAIGRQGKRIACILITLCVSRLRYIVSFILGDSTSNKSRGIGTGRDAVSYTGPPASFLEQGHNSSILMRCWLLYI